MSRPSSVTLWRITSRPWRRRASEMTVSWRFPARLFKPWDRRALPRSAQLAVRTLGFALVLLLQLVVPHTCPAQELFTDKSDLAATEVDRMYVKGLQHLVRTQGPDGRWSDGPYGGE